MGPHSAPASNTDIARWNCCASVAEQKRTKFRRKRRKLFDDIYAGCEADYHDCEYNNEFHAIISLVDGFVPFAAKELTQG
jgi:hypothetical protein